MAATALTVTTLAACGSASDESNGGSEASGSSAGGAGGGGGNWKQQTSSSTAMLAALKRASDKKDPIVVALWRPHWAYDAYPVKDLKDPKGALGKAEDIRTVAHKGFPTKQPKVSAALKKFKMNDDQLASISSAVAVDHKDDPAAGVDAWLKKNPDFVKKTVGSAKLCDSSDPVKISVINSWAEGLAVTHLWKKILGDRGCTVEVKEYTEAGPLYIGLSKGSSDFYMDAWLPMTHADYWNKYKKDYVNIGTWYGNAKLTMAVPTYMDIDSIEDLPKVAKDVNNTITGIEPGAGLTKATNKAIKDYNLG